MANELERLAMQIAWSITTGPVETEPKLTQPGIEAAKAYHDGVTVWIVKAYDIMIDEYQYRVWHAKGHF